MSNTITATEIADTLKRVADALEASNAYLTELDQAMGDGDLGITTSKMAAAIREHAANPPTGDLGAYIAAAGMAVNRAAPSTMGTLLATALMRAGKAAREQNELSGQNLAEMLTAADQGIQERGKAKPGDKTIVDALHPAAEALAKAINEGATLPEAGEKMLAAAQAGLEAATPLRSKIGRASWVGERTEGQVDPGCATLVVILKAILNRV